MCRRDFCAEILVFGVAMRFWAFCVLAGWVLVARAGDALPVSSQKKRAGELGFLAGKGFVVGKTPKNVPHLLSLL